MPELPWSSWLSPAQAGRVLGVTSQRVQDLVDSGRLVGVRTPLGRLVDPQSVERLVAERAARVASTER